MFHSVSCLTFYTQYALIDLPNQMHARHNHFDRNNVHSRVRRIENVETSNNNNNKKGSDFPFVSMLVHWGGLFNERGKAGICLDLRAITSNFFFRGKHHFGLNGFALNDVFIFTYKLLLLSLKHLSDSFNRE